MKNGDPPEKRGNFKKLEGAQRWEEKAVYLRQWCQLCY
jgi:hypothetical protein